MSEQSDDQPRRLSGLGEQVGTLAVAILVTLLFRTLVMEPFRIPSGSMYPTLVVGDHLFVNKFAYGARIPFTDLRLPAWREPRRGDIIVFSVGRDGMQTRPADRYPDLPREQFVKRLIGLPGDRIEFVDGGVRVNGVSAVRRTTDRGFPDESGRELRVVEVTLDGRRFQVLDDPRVSDRAREPFVVEPGRYFVLGDNRDNSKDSRYWGTVRREELKGPAFLLYWSWDYQGGWLGLFNPLTWWEAEKRWERVGARL